MKIHPVLLAAGQGTRMKSSLPKVLHPLLGRPMVEYGLEIMSQISNEAPVLVVGHGAEVVQHAVGDRARFVIQEQQLGTGHAVLCTEPVLGMERGLVVVAYADMPLLTVKSLQKLVETQKANRGPLSLVTVVMEDAHGFGRIIRSKTGSVQMIVEEAQATPEQLQIKELNAGVYCIEAGWLWGALKRIAISPKGEYYLTDLMEIALKDGLEVQGVALDDPQEVIGINTRVHLAEAEAVLRKRINTSWMLTGVTLVDPATTYIEPGVTIGQDTVIWPNTYLRGKTQIGEGCILGPNTMIVDTRVANRCTILSSVLEGAVLEDGVSMGPFGHLRKGAHLGEGVHMGNFGEVKSSFLGAGTKMGHFSYIGDATIGPNVNIGAGAITCNFDGVHKNPTEIGENAFIGSDTMLVAPVKIGAGAKTGAGAVVTHDVPPESVVVGVPARPLHKPREGS